MKLPYDEEEEGEDVPLGDKILLFTGNAVLSHLETSFHTKELGSVEFRVLFHIVSNCIFPRAGGFDKVYNDDVNIMYALVHGLKIHLATSMIKFMLDQKKRKNGCLPFGMVLTKLFKYFNVELRKEYSYAVDSFSMINESTLRRMQLTKSNGQWIDKKLIQSMQAPEANSPEEGDGHKEQDPEAAPEQEQGRAQEQGVEDTNQGLQEHQFHEDVAGFDHFSMSDLLGASSQPLPTYTPSPTHPSQEPVPPPPHPSQPSHVSHTFMAPIDFSPVLSFMESQFNQLNSRVSQLESKVEAVHTDLSSFKHDISTKLSETHEKMDLIASSFGNHCPRISQSLQEMSDYLDLHTKQMNNAMISATTSIQDIRDNTDKVCLKYKLPSLQEILRDLDAQVRRAYRASRQGRRPSKAHPPPKPKSRPSHSKPPPPHSASHTTTDPLSDSGSSDSSDSSDSPNPFAHLSPEDPYTDKVRSESE